VQLQSGVCSDMDEHGTFVLCDFAHCVKSLATQYAKTGKNITKKMRNKNGKNVQVCMYVIYGHFYKLGQFVTCEILLISTQLSSLRKTVVQMKRTLLCTC